MLSVCINDLATQNNPVDILCITEHNMIDGDEVYLTIPNYKLASYFMRQNRHGGSCILIKNNLKFRILNEITKLSICNTIECSAIELLEHQIVVLCIYRPPNNSAGSIDSFFTTLNKILNNVSKHGRKIIMCGDFNIDTLKHTKLSIEFTEILTRYNLKLKFNQVTRFANKTCIDNIAHNIRACKGSIKELALSDHYAQIVKVPVKKTCNIKYWFILKRDYSQGNRAIFIKYLNQLTNSDVYSCLDANTAYNIFHDNFIMLYNLCFPIKKVKMHNRSRPKWISRGLKICSKRKCQLLWQYRHNPNQTTKTTFKAYAKKYKTIIRLTKKSQNDYFIKSALNKNKATWKVINDIKGKYPNEGVAQLIINDVTINNPQDIANSFNDFFLDINKNNTSVPHESSNRLTYNSNSIFMRPTTPDDINKIIISLKNKNSAGYDNVTTNIVKDVAHIISEPLSFIINLCIEEGTFPDKLKISVIKPVFKKGDKTNMSNYRPIALIPIFGKIFEKVMFNCLYIYK
ncbi:hypothetical protein PYW08_001466 [Mythimna loreyi]|uniref:Uncharacterized protein n=1 Tax=Mythimna loreyi TaxID=667449 RepID=A0ACC2R4M0_9NEOP|nr:hypothetical protein PYW08_001466 [Mythimna loreyi]